MNNADEFIIEDGVLETYNGDGGDVIIPEGVTSIGDFAFYRCSGLTSVVIPEGVTSIGFDAFKECSDLISVTIPKGVTYIFGWAFAGCSSLTDIIIPDSVEFMANEVFGECSSLTSVTLPDSLMSIEERMFYECKSLTSITIPESVTSIENSAFESCKNLININIPDGVTHIGDCAFWNCVNLSGITIPESVKYIGDGVFWNCGDIDNVNNMNRETVSEYSKYEVTATDHLNLMQIVKRDIYYRDKYGIRIDSNGKLFSEQDKSMGEKFDIPGVVSIGNKGLAGRDFTTITFPETLQTIHMQAFMNCANLKCVEVSDSVEELSSNVF